MPRPRYRELPEAHLGGRSAQGVFGAHDELGTLGAITPEHVTAAARLVQHGRIFLSTRRGGPRSASVSDSYDGTAHRVAPDGRSRTTTCGTTCIRRAVATDSLATSDTRPTSFTTGRPHARLRRVSATRSSRGRSGDRRTWCAARHPRSFAKAGKDWIRPVPRPSSSTISSSR